MNCPFVKGWVPFRSSTEDKPANVIKESEKVDVPKDWKDAPLKLEDNPHKKFYALSEFKVLYPKALETYLNEIFNIVRKTLQEYHIKVELNRLDGEMIVKSTPKTFDPVVILKAHSVIRLLSRFVPVEEALTVLQENMSEDIISINHNKKDTFLRRKTRIENAEIKELIKEVLDCKIFVSGKSVAAIGSYENLKKVRQIVQECFVRNIHPIYHLKRFQIMNKLIQIPEMANKDWTNYLPPIPKNKNVKRKKPLKVRDKTEYTPFPPQQTESKIDKELESGVFHLKYERNKNNYYKPIAKKSKRSSDDKE